MDTRNITRFFKGIAIFLVFLSHSHQTFDLPSRLNDIFYFFQIGVQLFMLLSAMGLCFSYSKAPLGWLDFMKKRLMKIAVLYWCAIILAAIYRVLRAIVLHEDIITNLNPLGILINALLLHGFSSDRTINNQIVRGGWFIGTIVILYALFPLIYKMYFLKHNTWEKIRIWAFPVSVFAISSLIIFVLKKIDVSYTFTNLFSQLTPFCLGFSLFDLQKCNTIHKVKFPLCKSLLFFILTLFLYFGDFEMQRLYIFSISIVFFYFIVFIIKNKTMVAAINKNNYIFKFFNAMGEYSFPIFLTHSYIAFDFCYIVTTILSCFYTSDLLWFILLQPFVIALAYFVGKIFKTSISFILSKIKKEI